MGQVLLFLLVVDIISLGPRAVDQKQTIRVATKALSTQIRLITAISRGKHSRPRYVLTQMSMCVRLCIRRD